MTDLSVNLKKIIHAPIQNVFDAWLDAETLSKFMTPIPGMPEPRTESDGCEGGSFTIFMMVDEKEIPHKGKYLEVNRPDRLVFTWESPFSTDGSTVTIHFISIDAERTEIDFTHVKFNDEETRSNHEDGWMSILDKLDQITSLVELK